MNSQPPQEKEYKLCKKHSTGTWSTGYCQDCSKLNPQPPQEKKECKFNPNKLCRNPDCTVHSLHNISYEKCIDFRSKNPFSITDGLKFVPPQESDWEKEFESKFVFAVKYRYDETGIVDFDYARDEREELKRWIKSLLASSKAKLIEEIVEKFPLKKVERWVIQACPCVDEKAIAYNQALDEALVSIKAMSK